MQLTDILTLLGGLALFLYGMQMMSTGLEAAAGNRMKQILEKLTTNRICGVLVGAGITAVIQSSSATTVMVVGFVNSGIMTLRQAVWIIMGANIGTTITGQLIALDVGVLAPVFAFIGVVMVVFLKGASVHHAGQIIAGLGVLFIGMDFMSTSMEPLRQSQVFIDLMTKFQNPILGILAGMIFTAIIQSSSASVGILQALARSGIIALPSAVFVLFGQNIGTCITAVLASIGTNRNAKRTTLIHLLFNIIGTCIFVTICSFTPFTSWVAGWTPADVDAQIANVHTIFNVTTTLILLPFGTLLAKLTTIILPERKGEQEEGLHLQYIDPNELRRDHKIGSVAIFIAQLRQEVLRMFLMANRNVELSFEVVQKNSQTLQKEIENREEYIDYLNKEISRSISQMMAAEMPQGDSETINSYFKITGNIERIGDHATNIAGYAAMLEDKKLKFSGKAIAEVQQMKELSLDGINLLLKHSDNPLVLLEQMAKAEQKIDDLTMEFRQNQLDRMKSGECSGEACVIYSEMLTDFERIGDHLLNIAQAISKAGAQSSVTLSPQALAQSV